MPNLPVTLTAAETPPDDAFTAAPDDRRGRPTAPRSRLMQTRVTLSQSNAGSKSAAKTAAWRNAPRDSVTPGPEP